MGAYFLLLGGDLLELVKFTRTVDSKLSTLPIVKGQVIYTSDTHRQYWDVEDGQRVSIEEIIQLNTDTERTELLTPINSFYYVKATHVLWRYDSEWIQVTIASSEIQNMFNGFTKTVQIGDVSKNAENGTIVFSAEEVKSALGIEDFYFEEIN